MGVLSRITRPVWRIVAQKPCAPVRGFGHGAMVCDIQCTDNKVLDLVFADCRKSSPSPDRYMPVWRVPVFFWRNTALLFLGWIKFVALTLTDADTVPCDLQFRDDDPCLKHPLFLRQLLCLACRLARAARTHKMRSLALAGARLLLPSLARTHVTPRLLLRAAVQPAHWPMIWVFRARPRALSAQTHCFYSRARTILARLFSSERHAYV